MATPDTPMFGMAMPNMAMPNMTMSGPAMSGDVAAPASMMLCPVVLGLIVLSTILAATTLLASARDRHRRVSAGRFARLLARLPILPASVAVAVAGSAAIAAMVAVDGDAAFDATLFVELIAIVGGMSLAAVVVATTVARVVIVLGERLRLSLICAIAHCAHTTVLAVVIDRPLRADVVSAVAYGRGLRAPPLLAS